MTNQVKRSVISMEQDELKNLVSEVKETIAHDVHKNTGNNAPQLSAADVWNIQKNRRQRFVRRNLIWN